VVQTVAGELAGTGVVVQINTAENPRLADRFGIRSIPAVLFLRKGQAVDSVSGAMDRDSLLAWWRNHPV
jgi:thioredoxin-like negative regulator of GroEL